MHSDGNFVDGEATKTVRGRGRPVGTARGFRVENQKWVVAWLLWEVFHAAGLSRNNAAVVVFMVYVDPAHGTDFLDAVQLEDGRIKISLKLQKRKTGGPKRHLRWEAALIGGVRMDLTNFKTALADVRRHATRNGQIQLDGDGWFKEASSEVLFWQFGASDALKALSWLRLRNNFQRALFPAAQPALAHLSVDELVARRADELAAHYAATGELLPF